MAEGQPPPEAPSAGEQLRGEVSSVLTVLGSLRTLLEHQQREVDAMHLHVVQIELAVRNAHHSVSASASETAELLQGTHKIMFDHAVHQLRATMCAVPSRVCAATSQFSTLAFPLPGTSAHTQGMRATCVHVPASHPRTRAPWCSHPPLRSLPPRATSFPYSLVCRAPRQGGSSHLACSSARHSCEETPLAGGGVPADRPAARCQSELAGPPPVLVPRSVLLPVEEALPGRHPSSGVGSHDEEGNGSGGGVSHRQGSMPVQSVVHGGNAVPCDLPHQCSCARLPGSSDQHSCEETPPPTSSGVPADCFVLCNQSALADPPPVLLPRTLLVPVVESSPVPHRGSRVGISDQARDVPDSTYEEA